MSSEQGAVSEQTFMKRLAIIFTTGFIGLLLCGSTIEQRKFKGDLYFKLVTIGSYYHVDSVAAKNFDRTLDSLMKTDREKLSKSNRDLVSIYSGLKQHGLIDKPFFDLRVNSKTAHIVYTSSTEFNKIKDFNLDSLLSNNKKVRIELTGKIIYLGDLKVLSCSTIDKVKKVDGKTYWAK